MAHRQGDLDRATQLLEESLVLYRGVNDRRYIGIVLNALSRVAHDRADVERALALARESLLARREVGDRQGLAEVLETLAALAAGSDPSQPAQAARLLGAAHALREAVGAPVPAIERDEYDRLIAGLKLEFDARSDQAPGAGEAAFQVAWMAGVVVGGGAPEKLIEFALEASSGVTGAQTPV